MMTFFQFAGSLLVVGSLAAGPAAHAESTAKAVAVSGADAQTTALGTWQGEWTNDATGGSGTVTIEITSADGGSLSGKGNTTGGPCDRDFTVTGWYRASLADLRLALPEGGSGCAAAQVSISMRMGSQGGKVVGLGHWANMEEGIAAGKAFGIVQFTKK